MRFGGGAGSCRRRLARVSAIESRSQATAMDPLDTRPTAAADPDLANARKYVKRLREFYRLLAVAVLVTGLTAAINLMTGGRLWFYWVIVGFGVALAFSALDTFGRHLWLGRDWQDRKLRAVLARRAGAGTR
jgi:hypothetical protein